MLYLLMPTNCEKPPNHTVISLINNFNTKSQCFYYKTQQEMGGDGSPKFGLLADLLVYSPEHNWVHLSKRQYCLACRVDKLRVSRQSLVEVDGNEVKKRRCGAQTVWGCSCCKNAEFWDAIHALIHQE